MRPFLHFQDGAIDERWSLGESDLDILLCISRRFDRDIDRDACLGIGDRIGNRLCDKDVFLLGGISHPHRKERNPEPLCIVDRVSSIRIIPVRNQHNPPNILFFNLLLEACESGGKVGSLPVKAEGIGKSGLLRLKF